MRLHQFQNTYLYEGLTLSESRSVLLWETAGFKLREAALQPAQIQQIFADVEAGTTASGANRTLLGKGKDAASAVNTAWEDLKTKVQDSAPIKNVDAAYDNAVAKIEAGLGGSDNAVNKVIQKYRKFAKEHPIAQGLIYSALIAAAGISGAGLGGAAVLGLLKMTDKLLQGEKFSSAAYAGGKTGAMAYGASKLGDYLKGKPEGGASGGEVPADIQQGLAADQAFQDRILNKFPPDKGYTFDSSGDSLQVFDSTGRKVFTGDIPLKTMDMKTFADLTNNGQMATPGISSGSVSSDAMAGVSDKVAGAGADAAAKAADVATSQPYGAGMSSEYLQRVIDAGGKSGVRFKISPEDAQKALDWQAQAGGAAADAATSAGKAAGGYSADYLQQVIDGTHPRPMINKDRAAELLKAMQGESVNRTGKQLSEGQVYMILHRVCNLNESVIAEGPMDFIKGAAAKGIDKLKTVGKNLTTIITADKLNKAWQAAGAPTDSEELKQLLISQGVDTSVIDSVYAGLKLTPAAGEISFAEVEALIKTLNAKSKKQVIAYLQKQIGKA